MSNAKPESREQTTLIFKFQPNHATNGSKCPGTVRAAIAEATATDNESARNWQRRTAQSSGLIPLVSRIIENPIQRPGTGELIGYNLNTGIVQPNDRGKQAARLIVIRRRKMRKHKLKKLRKRMKFEWLKVRQRRELRKEKLFQAELINQIKEAEKFSAEAYVTEKLRRDVS
ncbi:uncharacterized protein LOC128276654, partial [Anopheles cruzii]|uniref:uncharacterized protein LOC128276654 n=1 Tax=Anopheles cruzii TaxID=68878 RepID=UPI0022EC7AC3